MSVTLDTAPLAPSPDRAVRPRAFARKVVRWMLRDSELNGRYKDPNWVPYTAWSVLDAVAELICLDPEVREYRMHPHDAVFGLGARVARQVGQGTMGAEVERALALLARAGLIVLTEGGMRLGRDYEPDCPHPVLKVTGASEAKATAARANGKAGGRPPGQRDILLPLKGDLSTQLPNDVRKPTAEPTVGSDGFAAETQIEPTVGPTETHGGSALGSASRAQPLYSSTAVAAKDESLESATAAAITAPAPRADAVALPAEPHSRRDAVGTQTEPTVGPPATQTGTQAQRTEQPKPAPVGAGELARTLAAEMLRAVRLAAAHETAAPGIMQGYLDEGRPAEQIRWAMSTLPNRTTPVQSANVLRSIMDGRFPAPAREGGMMARPASAPIEDIAAAPSNHPGFPEIGDPKDFSVGTRNTINRLLEKLDREDLASRHQTARYLFDDDRPAFLAVARRHPGLWKLIREEPPDPDAAAPMSERIGVE